MFLYSQNEVCFEIESNPYPNSSSLGCFSKYIRVLDCFDVYAESTVSDEKVLHVSAIIAELLVKKFTKYIEQQEELERLGLTEQDCTVPPNALGVSLKK